MLLASLLFFTMGISTWGSCNVKNCYWLIPTNNLMIELFPLSQLWLRWNNNSLEWGFTREVPDKWQFSRDGASGRALTLQCPSRGCAASGFHSCHGCKAVGCQSYHESREKGMKLGQGKSPQSSLFLMRCRYFFWKECSLHCWGS